MKGNARHMFPGSNTPIGFYSFFDNIWGDNPKIKYIIKGGPGTGKSTLLKKIGQHMLGLGYDVEYFHCSSDATSLDAIRIPALEVSLVDGTSPHIQEPQIPGAQDKLINLGDYWDDEKIIPHKKEIQEVMDQISKAFNRCYRFLNAAAKVYKEISTNAGVIDFESIRRLASQIMNNWFTSPSLNGPRGKSRHLFASAITPSGVHNFLPNLMDPLETKYILKGAPGTGKSAFLQQITHCALDHSYNVEVYHCPFNPNRIDHIIIPNLKVAFITSIDPHQYHSDQAEVIDFNQIVEKPAASNLASRTEEDWQLYQALFTRAIDTLKEEKEMHDQLEDFYSSYMDFDKVETLKKSLIEEIGTLEK